jgi:hypothetical protein
LGAETIAATACLPEMHPLHPLKFIPTCASLGYACGLSEQVTVKIMVGNLKNPKKYFVGVGIEIF